MKNLMVETLTAILQNDRSPSSVRWIGTPTYAMTWDKFAELADFEYDENDGCTCIARDLVVVGIDWWLERAGCAGCEFWAFKTLPKMPTLGSHTILTFHTADDEASILKEK